MTRSLLLALSSNDACRHLSLRRPPRVDIDNVQHVEKSTSAGLKLKWLWKHDRLFLRRRSFGRLKLRWCRPLEQHTHARPAASACCYEHGFSLVGDRSAVYFIIKFMNSNVYSADASTPPIYQKALNTADPSGSGEISINSLSRVLLTSGLSASTIDRVSGHKC